MQHLRPVMEHDSIDVFVSLLRNDEREEYMFIIEPAFRTKLKFQTYVRSCSDLAVDDIEDLHGKKISLGGGEYDLINNDANIETEKSLWNAAESFEKLKIRRR